jgi:hypothetical protein
VRGGVEEVVAGEVGLPVDGGRAVEHGRVQGPGEFVRGEDVEAVVAQEHGRQCDGVEKPLRGRFDPGLPAAHRRLRAAARDHRQVEEVGAFLVGELQSPGDGGEDLGGHAADVALLEAGVPLRADAGEHGDLLPAESGDASTGARGEAELLRGEPRAPADEEVADVVTGGARGVHTPTVDRFAAERGVEVMPP